MVEQLPPLEHLAAAAAHRKALRELQEARGTPAYFERLAASRLAGQVFVHAKKRYERACAGTVPRTKVHS